MTQTNVEILIVEDDGAILEAFSEALTDEGYAVAGATGATQALAMLREASTLPRLILLDLMLPQISGWELLSMLKQDSYLAAIPVVAMTATGSPAQDVVALGAVAYLAKPIALDTLLGTVQRYLA